MVQLPPDAPPPRLCLVEKSAPDQEYGYNLHAEKHRGQFVGIVDEGSPAERGGLRTGDKIFAVNGHSIIGEPHKQVVKRIKENPVRCEMLVISEEGAAWYQERNIKITPDLPNIIKGGKSSTVSSRRASAANGSPPPAAGWYAPNKTADPVFIAPPPPKEEPTMSHHLPVLCTLEKQAPTDEFGFNLHAEKGRGHFIGAVDFGGIGEKAGLKMGQRIVGVNGLLIYPNTPHKEVVALIKKSPMSTTLLVASEEVDKWHKDNNEPFSFDHCEHGGVHQQLSPHSIQISDEEIEVSPVPKHDELEHIEEEVVHEHVSDHVNETNVPRYDTVPESVPQYDEPPAPMSMQYDLPPSDPTDLMSAVFGSVPPPEVDQYEIEYHEEVHVPAPVEQEHLNEHDGHSGAPLEAALSEYSTHESAVDVHHNYNPYNDNGLYAKSQSSPMSNGSSRNGYHSGQSSHSGHGDNADDIFGLSAKEARERLRQQKRHRPAMDMSLQEKYQLVSNM